MAKITRYSGDVQAFASQAVGTERTVFGEATQSNALTDQITAAFLRGWGIVGANDVPTREDFNAFAYTATQFIAYLHQAGVPEWDAVQEYHTGSIVQAGGVLYASQIDNNIGNDPTVDAVNWANASGFTPATQVHATFTGDGVTTTFDAGVALPAATALMVSVGGIIQTAVTDYSTSGTQVIFTTPPPTPQSGLDTPNIQIMGTVY